MAMMTSERKGGPFRRFKSAANCCAIKYAMLVPPPRISHHILLRHTGICCYAMLVVLTAER
eukprot:877649-Rhodomonas_salina.1